MIGYHQRSITRCQISALIYSVYTVAAQHKELMLSHAPNELDFSHVGVLSEPSVVHVLPVGIYIRVLPLC
jgi:hypothetical protein